ncbi:MAG: ectonucleotide pyrophosphatase/phosphodiesterase [Bacillota bacterium]|nr:ectonucleotide pyrophosphatase/phosphodiesterase [Bacillota bacterium]
MSNTPEYLVVVSFDALSTLDFDTINSLPNFHEYIKQCSFCKKVYSVYPSLTYPAHATIVTGRYPKKHGIINNTLLQPKRRVPDWFWYRKYIKGSTLYDKAIDAGLKTAALLWPVTGRSRIHYNMPEIFPNRPWHNQVMVSLLSGSPVYQALLNQKFGSFRKGLQQPELDNFVHQCALYTIKNYTPNLLFIHYVDLDSQRHKHGFHSLEAKSALIRHDTRLGELIKTLKDTGIYDNTALVLLGDHSSLDENKVINLNIILKERGLITLNSKGRITSWRAISKGCDGSAYIYLHKNNDQEALKTVEQILFELKASKSCGIEEVYSGSEAGKLGSDPDCSFMLEASKGFYFSDDLYGELVKEIKPGEIGRIDHCTAATHGYSPFKSDYTTMFFASGKGVKPGVEVNNMNLVDEGPTLAKLMGLQLEDVDGRILEEILEL